MSNRQEKSTTKKIQKHCYSIDSQVLISVNRRDVCAITVWYFVFQQNEFLKIMNRVRLSQFFIA